MEPVIKEDLPANTIPDPNELITVGILENIFAKHSLKLNSEITEAIKELEIIIIENTHVKIQEIRS